MKKGISSVLRSLQFNCPGLYRLMKKNYLRVRHFGSKAELQVTAGYQKKIVELSRFRNTFFGYYDKSPCNPENSELLVFHANNADPAKKPDPRQETDIILYDLDRSTVQKRIAATYAWNWQQGSRAHWLSPDKLIFNLFNRDEKQYNSGIYDLKKDSLDLIPFPVQDSFNDEYIVSIDYSALNLARPDYGYRNLKNGLHHRVIYCNLKTGASKTLVDARELAKKHIGHDDFSRTRFNVNHVHIAPDGTKFIYLFRYYLGRLRKHVLYLFDLKENSNRVLLENEIVSHYKWLNNDSFVYWGSFSGEQDFHLFDTGSAVVQSLKTGLPDGHPSVLDAETLLADSYPDRGRMRRLHTIGLNSGEISEIACFFEGPSFSGECRCDMHANASREGRYVNFDALVGGGRKLVIISRE